MNCMAAKNRKKDSEFAKFCGFVRKAYNWVIVPWCTAFLVGYLYLSFTRDVSLYLMHPFWTRLVQFSFIVVALKIVSALSKTPGGGGFIGDGYL